jgi:hypothetical protein
MDLYGDLPPALGDSNTGKSKTIGWARPALNLFPRQIQTSSDQSHKDTIIANESTTVQKPTDKKNVMKMPNSLAFKPRQATIPIITTVGVNSVHSKVVTTENIHHSKKQAPINENHYNDINTKNNEKNEKTQHPDKTQEDTRFNTNDNFDVDDPYDPCKPNDYIAYCEERLEKKRLKRMEEENKIKFEELERDRNEREKERLNAAKSGLF